MTKFQKKKVLPFFRDPSIIKRTLPGCLDMKLLIDWEQSVIQIIKNSLHFVMQFRISLLLLCSLLSNISRIDSGVVDIDIFIKLLNPDANDSSFKHHKVHGTSWCTLERKKLLSLSFEIHRSMNDFINSRWRKWEIERNCNHKIRYCTSAAIYSRSTDNHKDSSLNIKLLNDRRFNFTQIQSTPQCNLEWIIAQSAAAFYSRSVNHHKVWVLKSLLIEFKWSRTIDIYYKSTWCSLLFNTHRSSQRLWSPDIKLLNDPERWMIQTITNPEHTTMQSRNKLLLCCSYISPSITRTVLILSIDWNLETDHTAITQPPSQELDTSHRLMHAWFKEPSGR